MRTGISAATTHGLGTSDSPTGDVYIEPALMSDLVEKFFLIPATSGNLTLRLVASGWHLRTASHTGPQTVAPRAVVGVALADDCDARTQAAGRRLIMEVF